MTDPFGHHGARTQSAFIDSFGRGPLLLRYDGQDWWFEFSKMFGPQLLRKSDLEPCVRQPTSDNHPFWPAFLAWQKGGYRHRPVFSSGRGKNRVRRLRFYICFAARAQEATT